MFEDSAVPLGLSPLVPCWRSEGKFPQTDQSLPFRSVPSPLGGYTANLVSSFVSSRLFNVRLDYSKANSASRLVSRPNHVEKHTQCPSPQNSVFQLQDTGEGDRTRTSCGGG